MANENDERLHRICAARGLRLEDIKTYDDYAPRYSHFGWSATVGDYDLGCKVGTGPTQEAAIEDLLDQLD
jgi:hypothetical protein